MANELSRSEIAALGKEVTETIIEAEDALGRDIKETIEKHTGVPAFVGLTNAEVAEEVRSSRARETIMAVEGTQITSHKKSIFIATVNTIRKLVEEHDLVDVGKHSAPALGVSESMLIRVITHLKDEGYRVWYFPKRERRTGKNTSIKILTSGAYTNFVEVYNKREAVFQIWAVKEETVPEQRARLIQARHDRSIAKAEKQRALAEDVRDLKRKGLSNVAIGKQLGIAESTVRRRLQDPVPHNETMQLAMGEIMLDAQEFILERLTEHPEFNKAIGGRDKFILRISQPQWKAMYIEERLEFFFDTRFQATVKNED